ncbi:MucBP domain-containing protein [Levilactobacillus cerevisiae]|uniref:MucBP domain-containing protein n=1 Tax=Levilactobacillus cerevisiae TaxID=1704076 RepID=UPI000F791DC3|nr:MucBP domain-containing protein [Levilactobacillus cerevisiae]
MLNQLRTKHRYKMYKKGKHWLFASILATSLAISAVDVTANADTAADGDDPAVVEADGAQSQLQDKTVSLTPVTTADGGVVTSEPKAVEPAPAPADPDPVDPEPTDQEPAPQGVVPEDPAPADEAAGAAEHEEKVGQTPPAAAPEQTVKRMKASAPGTPPTTPTTPAVVVSPLAAQVAKVTIDDWLPNKTLQVTILNALNDLGIGRTWATPEDITQEDLALLTRLDVAGSSNSNFKDTYIDGTTAFSLKGLEYAVNITRLSLKSNLNASGQVFGDVTDISALANMKNLTYLDLAGNRITDISPLVGLTNLEDVDIQYNSILDLSGFYGMKVPKLKTWFQYVVLPVIRIDRATKSGTLTAAFIDEDNYHWKLSTAAKWWVATDSKVPGTTYGLAYYRGGDRQFNADGTITFNNMPEQEPGVTTYPDKHIHVQQYKYFMIGVVNEKDTNRIAMFQPYVLADQAGAVTVSYQDKAGKKLADDVVLEAKLIGDSYVTEAKYIAGYTLTAQPENSQGTYTAEDIAVVYVYDKTPVTPPVNPPVVTPSETVKVTVHYQTRAGLAIADDDVVTGQAGDSYTTTPASVAGYELIVTPANANGVFGNQDSEVTYVYAKMDGDSNLVDPGPEADKVDAEKSASDQPTGNKMNQRVTDGDAARIRQTPTVKAEGNSIVNLAVPQPVIAKETLPQTDERSVSPLWGLAVLGSLLGLAVVGRKRKK